MRTHIALPVLAVLLAGCGRSPAVRTARDLPIEEVVLYRNGVGYFERRGHFEGDELGFRVRATDVGDFLSSLTAIDAQRRASVRSVAFEIPPPSKSPDGPMPTDGVVPKEEPPELSERSRDVNITLHLEGEEHDLVVAYVVGTPIWRPSYRLVVDPSQQGVLLQAWAIVQNNSGEDWRDVKLSLTTGAPIAFRSDLGTPIEPERPLVTDRGEVVMHVPGAEVAVAQSAADDADTGMAAPAEPPSVAWEQEEVEEALMERRESKASKARPTASPRAPAPMVTADGLERSVKQVASLSSVGESVTRYDIDQRVTVPDGGSTMVAVLSSRIPGERAYLFAPDFGVGESVAHPFEVVRLENATEAVLEAGPVSVLTSGAFLGHGLLETLPRNATAFIPFAVEKSVVVEPSQAYEEVEGKLISVQQSRVTVERFSQRTTRYAIRNGGERAARVYVRHARLYGSNLITEPEGTELTPGNALIPHEVKPHGEATLEVVERSPVRRELDFMSSVAADAVQLWLEGPAVDAAQGPALKRALEIRSESLAAQNALRQVTQQRARLAEAAQETRDNLQAIAKIKSAADLRQRLVERLSQLDGQLAEMTKTLVEGETRVNELTVRLSEALEAVSLIPAAATKP